MRFNGWHKTLSSISIKTVLSLQQPVRQLHKHGVVGQPVILPSRFEGEQKVDFVFVHIVVRLDKEARRHLVEHDGLVHVIPAPGDVVATLEDVSLLHLVGELIEVVNGHKARVNPD